MSVEAYQRYFNSIVQICAMEPRRTGWRVVGAGVIVDAMTIMTCSHVVAFALGCTADAKRSDLPDDAVVDVRRVFVDDPSSKPLAARLLTFMPRQAGGKTADLAVLRLDTPLDISAERNIAEFAVLPSAVAGLSVVAFGFPEGAAETMAQTEPATYRLRSFLPNGWIFALDAAAYGQEIREGFSGAPVMEEISGRLVGMVCEADSGRRTVTLIPTKCLQSVYEFASGDGPAVAAAELKEIEAVRVQVATPGKRLLLEKLTPRLHRLLTVVLRILSDPPEREALEKYLSEREAEWRHDLDDKTYLPPPTKQLAPPPPRLLGAPRGFSSALHQLIREIGGQSSGGDAASAQISALGRRSQPVSNLLERLLTSREPLMLLGEPGAGKSITLKQVAIEVCERNRKRVFPSLCLLIPLGRWQPVQHPGIADVERLVVSAAPAHLQLAVQELAHQGRLVVIFDGLDEMSRQAYTQHTEALSEYAERYQGSVHALFSCRSADFSPAFRHRRLVLMPFGRRQIRQYLKRQLGGERLTIADQSFSIAQLAKRLDTEALPIQPRNPFSLWLLALYMREKSALPNSRVALLEFFYEYQYRRKQDEAAEKNEDFLERDSLFESLGRLALFITMRNLGTDLPLNAVWPLFGSTAAKFLDTALKCGVLQRSLDLQPPLIRFDHHRAQEYFAAYDIVKGKRTVDWSSRLDIPRWQETLVNVAQMDGGSAPLQILNDCLIEMVATPTAQNMSPVERAEQEALAAERVELSGRVLRVIPESPDSELLCSNIRAAANFLAAKGNPISQVKMLRLARELPQLKLHDLVSFATRSTITWVRERAQEVAAQLAPTPSGSLYPEEITRSLANGLILRHLPSRLASAKRLKSPGLALVSMTAALVFLLQAALSALIVPAMAFKMVWIFVQILSDADSKFSKVAVGPSSAALIWDHVHEVVQLLGAFAVWMPWAVLGTTTIALFVCLALRPAAHWIATPATGLGTLIVGMIGLYLWMQAPTMSLFDMLVTLLAIGFIVYILSGVLTVLMLLPAMVGWLTGSVVFALALRAWTHERQRLRYTVRTTWAGGEYGVYCSQVSKHWRFSLGLPIGFLALGFAERVNWINALFEGGAKIGGLILAHAGLLLIGAATVLALFVTVGVLGRLRLIRLKNPNGFIYAPLGVGAAIGVWLGIPWLGLRLLSFLFHGEGKAFLGRLPAEWTVRGILFAASLVLACALLYPIFVGARWGWKVLQRWLRSRMRLGMSVAEFREALSRGSAGDQAELFQAVTPELLKITPGALHTLLVEIEGLVIEADRAQTSYLSKRAEVQDLVRQERAG